jgi:tRNA-splicing ligase RtcB
MRVTEGKNVPIKIWDDKVIIEEAAMKQLINLSALPFIFKHVAVMPDAHWGMGSTVGSVIATKGAIIPAAVGVDIGCGMMAVKLPFKIDTLHDLPKLRHSIERSVPVGFNNHSVISNEALSSVKVTMPNGDIISKKHLSQIGTLGGGNHFIEICQDQNNDAWVMLHSGSRNLGKTMAERHIDKAKGIMKQYFIDLPDPDLAYFVKDTPEFKAYILDLLYAQNYAMANRKVMMNNVLREITYHLNNDEQFKQEATFDHLFTVNCHHNFTQIENHFGSNIWVTRKGAVSAKEDQYGIIPGSMGAKSFIVKGKGNLESFCSCSHGAGRSMSRNEAKRRYTLEDQIQATEGVECRKDSEVIDEIPMAYKNIQDVMDSQADLVDIIYTLKQVLCIKG